MNKSLHRLLGLLAAFLLATLLYIIVIDTEPGPSPQRFEEARACLQQIGEARYARSSFSAVFSGHAPIEDSCWRSMALPVHEPLPGTGLMQAWFKVDYTVPADLPANETVMVYVPRVMGAAWQLLVDDQPVANNLDDWRMTWNKPLAVRLDPSRVRAGQRLDIRIGVIGRNEYGASLAPIMVGPASGIAPSLARRTMLQITMPQASSMVLILMGSFFFAFWLARPAEHTHLLLALASVAWCVCNLQYTLHRPDDTMLADWYGSLVNIAISWVMWLVYLFALRIDATQRVRWLERALPWFVLFMTLVALPLWPHGEDTGVVYQLVNAIVAIGVTLVIWRQAWRKGERKGGRTELRVISVALMLSMVAGSHDVALLAQLISPESIYLLPYGTLLLFGSLLYAVQRRYVAAIAETEHFSAALAERLTERETELRQQHTRLLCVEREQALLLERQRLMRDMHDGIGSALMSSLVLVEQGRLPSKDVAAMLRECVDDLRLVIDSLEPIGHDLITLLATLRYRLGKRLEHAGLALEWGVQDLPTLPWLDPSHALQVLRILQETLTNILKHAQARKVSIHTAVLSKPGMPDQVCVRIEDDGQGFDIDTATPGRGLRHLRQRAHQLHGALDIRSQAGQGTRVTLLLPVALTSERIGH
jgi:signal transduction histidine kinase